MQPAYCAGKGEDVEVRGPVSLFDAVTAAGPRGRRAAAPAGGVREMNPQLWETTLNTNVRSLLQVAEEVPSKRPTTSSPS